MAGRFPIINRKDPNFFEDITDIPDSNQTLQDILKGIRQKNQIAIITEFDMIYDNCGTNLGLLQDKIDTKR